MRTGRPRKDPADLLSETVPVRFTKKEVEVLCKLAGRVSLSRFIRRQLGPIFAQTKVVTSTNRG